MLRQVADLPVSYAPVGLASASSTPGYRVADERVVLGRGIGTFERATAALHAWRQFGLGWASIYPRQAALTTGTNVLVVAQHLGFWSINACRIVYTLPNGPTEGLNRRVVGFAYGTLVGHAETGEEIFQVSFDEVTENVEYRVRAVSRESALLARVGFPVARALQHRFRRDSARAMRRAIAEV